MMNSEFDPLAQLEEQGLLLSKLINAHNKHDELISDLAKQHQQVIDLIRTDRSKIVHLENKVKVMSKMLGELYADRSD